MPVDTLVVKVAAPCNLACKYCYEYSSGDESWRAKPIFLVPSFARMLGYRIREYSLRCAVTRVCVVIHGGEPLMLGAERLEELLITLRTAAAPVEIAFSLQTNGTLIDRSICEVFVRQRVAIGVSIDGSAAHNHLRVDRRGQPTWDRVIEGIRCLKAYALDRFVGLLCVVDVSNPPEEVMQALLDLDAPTIDLLQPFTSHDMAGEKRLEMAEKFGQWMVSAMEYWLKVSASDGSRVRVFDDALQAVCTRSPKTDWFGPRTVSYMIIETDGSYDLLDQLKSVGATSRELRSLNSTIFNCSLGSAENAAIELLSRKQGDRLPDDCELCQWADVCAAGHLPSRYSNLTDFNNRSAYCEGIDTLLERCASIMRSNGMAVPGRQHSRMEGNG